jgi:glycosyltransferase involved in cell wall biosynthesis
VSTPRTRVLLVGDTLSVGGTEGQFVEIACRLPRHRWDVRAACLRAEGPLRARLEQAGIQPWSCGAGALWTPRAAAALLRLARRLRGERIGIVHTFDFYSNIMGVLAARAAGVPVVASQRNLGTRNRTPARRGMSRLVLALADRVIANSTAVAAWLQRERLVRADKIDVVVNGVDTTRFRRADREASALRQHGDVGRMVIGTVANLRPEKGLLHLVTAAAFIRDRYDTRVAIWGEGRTRPELAAAVRDLGLDDVVALCGSTEQPERALADLDVFVQPSLTEATSNILLEAMAMALPIVATDVGGTPALIEHEVTGLLVPPGDSAAIAKAVIRLVETPELGARLGAAARSRVRARFGMGRMVTEVEAVYVRAMQHRDHR